jgi:hypothetical protein
VGKDSTDGDAKNLIGQTVDSQIPNTMTCSRSKREYFNNKRNRQFIKVFYWKKKEEEV